jgi:arylsulfatase
MKRSNLWSVVVVAAGGLLGYGAATGRLDWGTAARAAPQDRESVIPFELLVPADAVVEIGGHRTSETGAERRYDTPPLRAGGEYTYTIKATWRGKEVTRELTLRHGEANVLDLRPDFQASAPARTPVAARPVPRTAAPGSPAATRTLDGHYLPNPSPEFKGTINLNAVDSKPYWPATIVPPKGAPNVLLIMTDDVGFGAPSTFGGVIPTPNLDRIGKMGLRYTNFHSTALCSPTRAALITGRNHHSCGFGVISELATGYPGYDSVLVKEKATVGAILQQNGYGTSWFGKNHNTPAFVASQAGPFDQWPTGLGFDYFYGFVGGDTSQWQPNLFQNTSPIYPYLGKPGWNLTTAQADEAVHWLNQLNDIAPEKPFFCYYVPGGTHAPHHPTKEWVDKIHEMHLFDNGWNKLRDTIFANQKRLGVIPAGTQLTPWPKDLLKEWDQLNADEKKMFIRQVEVYAAYLAYTDHEIGRVIDAVEKMGKLDNTLIVYISGDNGSSAEGSLIGTPNEVASFNSIEVPVEAQLKNFYDVWGTDRTYNHMAVAWTWAFDTPFKWTKQVASHFGGTRQGMCMAWPSVIKDAGGMRHQFHHVIDIVPTILQATKITPPVQVNGIAQHPIEGVSMAYTWDKANEKAPTRHPTQYFEMFGNRGIYHDGWYACTTPLEAPWNLHDPAFTDIVNGFKWELYDLSKDWSQANDVAKDHPDKVRALQEAFLVEAQKYQVFPLDATKESRMVTPRPSTVAGRDTFVYTSNITGIPNNSAPTFLGRSYSLTAEVDIPANADGMINTNGGRFGGYGLYLLKGKPVFTWNLVDLQRVKWEGTQALSAGKHTISFEFTYDGPGLGKGGSGVLKVEGREVARKSMAHTIPATLQWDETFDVGSDMGTPVDDKDYQCPFAFTGKIERLTIKLGPNQMFPAERKAAQDKVGRRD